MKRSEMVKKFLDRMNQTDKENLGTLTEEQACDLIIKFVEECGMLPPVKEGKSKVKVMNRCKWDEET